MNMRVSLLLGAASVMALGACATNPDGSTGTTLSQTQQGALIGAAAGGLYGATRDSDKNNQGKDFLKGAVLGAAAGAVVGNIIEAQEKQLRQVMTSPGVQIINHGDYLQVIMPSGLLFASDSAATIRGRKTSGSTQRVIASTPTSSSATRPAATIRIHLKGRTRRL